MKVVYIAGPYRGATAWEVEQNIRAAEAMALEVAKRGAMPLCPHTNTRGYFEGQMPNRFWLEGTMELLRRCDAIMCLPTWEQSTGARAERSTAQDLSMPVFDDLGKLEAWLEAEHVRAIF